MRSLIMHLDVRNSPEADLLGHALSLRSSAVDPHLVASNLTYILSCDNGTAFGPDVYHAGHV